MESEQEEQKVRPDVPRYYRVSPRFWSDEKVRTWNTETRVLALYLLTSPHRNLEGMFVLPLPYICADLEWTEAKVKKHIEILVRDQFISYDIDVKLMLIRNALKYQCPESANVIKGALRRIRDLPHSPLFSEFLELAKRHCFRTGAPALAQAFYSKVEQALEPMSQRTSEYMNPNLQSQPQSGSQPRAQS